MRFTTVFTLGAVVVATSAFLTARQSGLPACVLTCSAKAPLDGCVDDDNACLCKSQIFVANSTECIEATCGSELQTALQDARAICAAVGVTLTATSFSTAASSSPTSSGSSNGSASTTTAPKSSSTSSASSSGSAPATTSNAAATAHGANAFIGLGAIFGVVALAL